MAKYLITGGAGFIGSHLAQTLVGRGDEVVVLDNLASGKRYFAATAYDAAGNESGFSNEVSAVVP